MSEWLQWSLPDDVAPKVVPVKVDGKRIGEAEVRVEDGKPVVGKVKPDPGCEALVAALVGPEVQASFVSINAAVKP